MQYIRHRHTKLLLSFFFLLILSILNFDPQGIRIGNERKVWSGLQK